MVLVRRATQMLLAALVVTLALLPAQPAAAEETVYRLIVTPQVWFANIPQDFNQNFLSGATATVRPERTLYPQWGGNIALQAGTWTFAVGSLATEYALIRDFTGGGFPANTQDRIEMSRWDTDFAVTYTFLDVIQDLMDFTIGVGAKYIRVTGSYQITNPPAGVTYGTGRIRETFTDNIYGPTIPMSFNFHLTKSLFLPISATGIIAQDEYSSTFGTNTTRTAYGGTGDVALRYIFSNGVAVTGGYRGQALQGGPVGQFGAHGPFFSMSVPFNF